MNIVFKVNTLPCCGMWMAKILKFYHHNLYFNIYLKDMGKHFILGAFNDHKMRNGIRIEYWLKRKFRWRPLTIWRAEEIEKKSGRPSPGLEQKMRGTLDLKQKSLYGRGSQEKKYFGNFLRPLRSLMAISLKYRTYHNTISLFINFFK